MITQTEVELYVRIKPYYEFVEFVSTMPGMTELSSTIVLAETGVDMDIFDDAKHLCSWCGLSPANNESAGKKKSVRIAKAGDYLKPMMVQCALAAIKSKNSLILQSNMVESKSDVDTKGNHCHCKNDDGLYLPHGFRKEALYPY